MTEIADQARWQNAVWKEPIDTAHSYGALLALAAADHLRGFVRLVDGDPFLLFSHLATARHVLDAASLSYWLSEPTTPDARVQRGQAYRLHGAKDQQRCPLPAAKKTAAAARLAVRDGAALHGWSTSGRDAKIVRVGSEEVPTPKQAIAHVLSASVAPKLDALAPAMWWFLSGHTHSATAALLQSLDRSTLQVGAASLVQEGAMMSDLRPAVWAGMLSGEAYAVAVDARLQLYGVVADEWNDAKHGWRTAALETQDRLPPY